MAIPAGSVKVSVIGTQAGGEEFNTSFWLTDAIVGTNTAANQLAATIVGLPAFTSWITAVKNMIPTTSRYTFLKVYAYNDTNNTASFVGQAAIPNGTGVATNASQPLQQCMVVSLLTVFAGRRNRGRMYIPATSYSLSQHQYDAGQATSIANATAALFNAVNLTANPGTVAVVSRVGSTASEVTSLRVDTKPDIQRRRANAQVAANFATAAVTP